MNSSYQTPLTQAQPMKCKSLLTCGGLLIALNGFLVFFSIIFMVIFLVDVTPMIAIFNGVFHIILGSLAVVGGGNTQRRGFIISSLVMSIVGAILFALPVFIFAILEWAVLDSSCRRRDCSLDEWSTLCYVCSRSLELYYLPFIIVSFLTIVINIVMSSVSCGRVCSCCCCYTPDENNSGFVVTQPQFGYPVQFQYAPQYQTQPPPPGYSLQQQYGVNSQPKMMTSHPSENY